MLQAIRQFFGSRIADDSGTEVSAQSLQLATAALLIETVRADHAITDVEYRAVQEAVRRQFRLDRESLDALLALAEEEVAQATDFYQFTSLANRHLSVGQKNRIVELMWQVAYADEHIDAHERHLIRKIADLLHVTHGDYLAAREAARAAVTSRSRNSSASVSGSGNG